MLSFWLTRYVYQESPLGLAEMEDRVRWAAGTIFSGMAIINSLIYLITEAFFLSEAGTDTVNLFHRCIRNRLNLAWTA